MLFNSWQFVALVAITFAFYYVSRLRTLQRFILVLASFVFYGAHHPGLLLLLAGSIGANFVFCRAIAHSDLQVARLIGATGVAANLGILIFFKYSGLLAETILKPLSNGEVVQLLTLIPLPIGISFFTFQGISLLVDTFRARTDEGLLTPLIESNKQHWLDVTLFISFFPQLVAGPIVKAHEFLPQIETKQISRIDWHVAFRSLVVGYFLKMVIADNLKSFTAWIEYPVFYTKSTLTLLTMLFGYSMQIFADFAGYSLIAIGVAALFGYRLPTNFNFPYIAASFSEFWRRWHISLSSFLKEYLYIPLGGNRNGNARTYINLMTTMLLGGLWHGAAWSYALWGFAHGLALVVERLLSDAFHASNSSFWRAVRVAFVFSYVTFAWLLFKLPQFAHVIEFADALRLNIGLHNDYGLIAKVVVYSFPIVAYHMMHLLREQLTLQCKAICESITLGAMMFLIATNGGPAADFIYFQF